MKDEEYVYRQDVREKSITGRSAHRARTHCGKGVRVRLPSDNLTKKELQKMNGECKTYRLNEPMKWAGFKELPDEHKITYIKLLRQKYNVSDTAIGEMLGVSQAAISKEIIRLGIQTGVRRNRSTMWDKAGWRAWAFGETVEDQEQNSAAESVVSEQMVDLPVENEPEEAVQNDSEDCAVEKKTLAPVSGSMSFDGSYDDVLKTVAMLLGGSKGTIIVQWCVEGS